MSAIVRALIRRSVVWLVPLSMLTQGVAVAAGPAPAQQPPSRVPQQTRLQAQAPATMPDLVGLTPRAAAEHAAVRRSRLQLVVEEVPGANSPEGVVFKQSVAPGTIIRPGTRVTIWIATGGVVVPPVVRLMLDAARDRLVRAGFRPEVVRLRSTAAVSGAVVRQEPEAGTRRPRGSTVRITVVAPDQTPPDVPDDANSNIEVPRLIGLVDREAAARLERVGLKGQRRLVQMAGATPGVVVEQLPLPGTRVRRGSTVLVTVADAPVNQEDTRPTPDPRLPCRIWLGGRSRPRWKTRASSSFGCRSFETTIDSRGAGLA